MTKPALYIRVLVVAHVVIDHAMVRTLLVGGATVAPLGDHQLQPSGSALVLALLSCCAAAAALVQRVFVGRRARAKREPRPAIEPEAPAPAPPPALEVPLVPEVQRAHIRAYRTGARFIRLS